MLTYQYDPFGRQVSRTQAGQTVYFLNDGPRLLEEYTATGQVLATHLHGPRLDEVLQTKQGKTVYARLEDGLGSVTEVLNGTGDLLERYTYDAFGLPTILAPDDTVRLTSAIGNRVMFTGREWDPIPELYNYRARYYEPTVGRFYSRDPIGQLPDVNLYRYVGNNPVNWVDPLGLVGIGDELLQTLLIAGGLGLVGTGLTFGIPGLTFTGAGLTGIGLLFWARGLRENVDFISRIEEKLGRDVDQYYEQLDELDALERRQGQGCVLPGNQP